MWDLPTNLAQEVSSVEELLRRGGCDSANSRLILQVHNHQSFDCETIPFDLLLVFNQAFRRLCFRLNWAQEQHFSPTNIAVLKVRI